MLRNLCLLTHVCLSLSIALSLSVPCIFVRVFRHDVFKVAPERFYRRELVAHRCDFFEGPVEFVDVLEDKF